MYHKNNADSYWHVASYIAINITAWLIKQKQKRTWIRTLYRVTINFWAKFSSFRKMWVNFIYWVHIHNTHGDNLLPLITMPKPMPKPKPLLQLGLWIFSYNFVLRDAQSSLKQRNRSVPVWNFQHCYEWCQSVCLCCVYEHSIWNHCHCL